MSNFSNGRRAPNVSQYLASLNTIPQAQPQLPQGDFSGLSDDGLEFLTNTEFFDFDGFNQDDTFIAPPPQKQQQQQNVQGMQGVQLPVGGDNMGMNGQFQFPDFTFGNNMPNAPTQQPMAPAPVNVQQAAYPAQQPIAQAQQPQPTQQDIQYPTPTTALSTPGNSGMKRKASSPELFEEGSRVAAEEDKRRRNTAASARFRVKKKQREQALETQAREMSEKLKMLEGKVNQLEMENKWLKGLITEKGEGKATGVAANGGERAGGVRSLGEGKEGVGTEKAGKVDAEE